MIEEEFVSILVDMQEKITQLYDTSVRQPEFNNFKDQVYRAFDEQTIFLKKLDEDSVVMRENMRQIKNLVSRHEQEIGLLSASEI